MASTVRLGKLSTEAQAPLHFVQSVPTECSELSLYTLAETNNDKDIISIIQNYIFDDLNGNQIFKK